VTPPLLPRRITGGPRHARKHEDPRDRFAPSGRSAAISTDWPIGSRRPASRTVAMESTGVYWILVFEILEAFDFEVLLVNARDVKNVPGRKTDVRLVAEC